MNKYGMITKEIVLNGVKMKLSKIFSFFNENFNNLGIANPLFIIDNTAIQRHSNINSIIENFTQNRIFASLFSISKHQRESFHIM